jgi:hypothetical protein
MEFAWFAETKKTWPSQRRKEWRERERDLHTIYIYYRTEKKAGRFERERERKREREREKRGEKGLLLLVIDFAGTIFSPTRTTDLLIICICRQPNAAKVVVVVGPS